MVYTPTRKEPSMAAQHYRCIKECFAYNKRFKKGQEFPMAWIDNGYTPPEKWFVRAEDYDDTIRRNDPVGKIVSAAYDPRPTAVLIESLSKYMGDIPKTWNRKHIWMELNRRESAESKTDPGPRKPGRPANPKET
jgi:hypothetical protein